MVPYEKILETAREENVDIIGLSGLITPSLEEMTTVAKEMTRQGLEVPLLIGGATTSKVHTAVKIAPGYSGPTVYVLDASRSVSVATSLLSERKRDSFVESISAEYEKVCTRHANRRRGPARPPIAVARAAAHKIDWPAQTPPRPTFLGLKSFDDYDLAELAGYIDWTPFFRTWELAGTYPRILEDEKVGDAARALFDDAKAMLEKIVAERWLRARATVGFFAANAVGDDVELYAGDNRGEVRATVHFLRQQIAKSGGRENFCLADFVAPKESGVADYLGAFVVTAGLGIEKKLAEFEAAQDDYSEILLKALADRLAEAFAERMHERVRKEFWGYAPGEALDGAALIHEDYAGIRPAPGYPACPDHSEKPALFDFLEAERRTGVTLTESFAMLPASSVSGYYFSHADARYFGIGKVGRDQVADYARRRGVPLAQAETWLAPNLGYER